MTDELQDADYYQLNTDEPPFAAPTDTVSELLDVIDNMRLAYGQDRISTMYFCLGQCASLADRIRVERSK